MRLGVIIGVAALVLLAGISAFAVVFFTRSGGDSAQDASSPSPSTSDSAAPSSGEPTENGAGLPADQAIEGDCLDKPDDVTATKIVECDSSNAAAEVVARADNPDAKNTKEAAAAECEDTDSDYTIYLLDDDAGSQRFVLCVKEL